MSAASAAPAELTVLRDKVALVTGGASGIGRATAFALAEAGAEVVVADLDTDAGAEVAAAVGGHAIATDVCDLEANRAAVAFAQERCGGLDLAFLNAGISTGCGIGEEFDLALYRRAIGVNLDGVVFGTHAVLSAMRKNDGPERGAIVATSSLAGLAGMPLEPIYSANKHAVVGFVRAVGPALAAEGIRFNAICPGFAETAIVEPIRGALSELGIPLIPPERVAATVVRLLAGAAGAGAAGGECWFVQPGREPAPFAFRGVPGPR
ncbi:MAG: short-chain dehydrogenase/reductase [Conexibacter sp.]|nr:short-chain dehydrogenase/reductase [Conexibacter sp.]